MICSNRIKSEGKRYNPGVAVLNGCCFNRCVTLLIIGLFSFENQFQLLCRKFPIQIKSTRLSEISGLPIFLGRGGYFSVATTCLFPESGSSAKKGKFLKKLQKTWKEKEGRKSLLKQNHFWWQSFLFFVINDNFRRNCFSAAGSSLSLSASSSSLAVAAADETETNFLRFLRKPELV